jgi:hypothetical protein
MICGRSKMRQERLINAPGMEDPEEDEVVTLANSRAVLVAAPSKDGFNAWLVEE